ncbi:MAG: hypothetical protein E6I18_02405 [Chloroflexi bacterium]|nr:MAG: hypothetical protein E6I18_02405 [Chloroflexota bacterium]
MHAAATWDDGGVPYLVAAIVAVLAAVTGWLARPLSPGPAERRELIEAVNAVDRELAANLELTSVFDQTKQAVTLENGEFARYRETLERDAGPAAAAIAALYEGMSEAESAMERRGPANSLRPEDRSLIEGWEGDARAAQRSLRDVLRARPRAGWPAVSARLHGRFARR